MNALISKIVKFNKVSVIGVFVTDEAVTYHYIAVKKRQNKLDVLKADTYASLEGLLNGIDVKLPAIIVIDGKGVLNKKIDMGIEADVKWKKNLDYSTVYFTWLMYESRNFISFCRKKMADDIIIGLQKKIPVIDFYIGPLLSVLLQESIGEGNVVSNNTVLMVEGNKLNTLHKNEGADSKSYTVGNSELTQYQLPLYGAAVQHFVNNSSFNKSTSPVINAEEVLYKKAFERFSLAMLACFFTLLLASYILINYYSGKNTELNQKTVFSSQSQQRIAALEQVKAQKLKVLEETGRLSKNFLTYYCYILVQSVPQGTVLNQLDVFPLAGEVKEKSRISIIPNIIVIKGTTAGEWSFNNWLDNLRDVKWIQKFEIVSLKKDTKGIQQFEIKIQIHDI